MVTWISNYKNQLAFNYLLMILTNIININEYLNINFHFKYEQNYLYICVCVYTNWVKFTPGVTLSNVTPPNNLL